MNLTTSTPGRADDRGHRMWVWVLGLSFVVVATGMAYSLWWAPVVRHQPYWITPGDIWYSVRTAHWIGWGSLSFVYSNNRSELITLPGFEVLLTPFVLLSSALGLSESAPGFFPNIHPQAWLLIGPVTLASGTIALSAFDSLARHMGMHESHRRILLIALEAAALWPALALWGHPEDVLAVGLAVFALTKVLEGKRTAAGWLLGGAIAMQLLVVFLVPAFVAILGLRKGGALLARAAILPGFLFMVVAIPDFHAAVATLFQQPAFPGGNHVTPWVRLSPKLARNVVAGGPARVFGLVFALLVGVSARTRRRQPAQVVWLMALAMGARCVFDAVIVPYYVMPAVALVLIAAVGHSPARYACTVAAGAGLTVMTFTQHDMWTYWLMMIAMMAVMLGLGWPAARLRPTEEPGAAGQVDRWSSDDRVPVPAGAR